MQRISEEPAIVLRSQKYSESSLLLDLYSQGFGRLKGIAKGVKRGNFSASAWQPFSVCSVSVSGRSELKNMRLNEQGKALLSRPDRLIFGLYLNELLYFLTREQDANEAIFLLYLNTLLRLNEVECVDESLRRFELQFLQELGYQLDFKIDS